MRLSYIWPNNVMVVGSERTEKDGTLCKMVMLLLFVVVVVVTLMGTTRVGLYRWPKSRKSIFLMRSCHDSVTCHCDISRISCKVTVLMSNVIVYHFNDTFLRFNLYPLNRFSLYRVFRSSVTPPNLKNLNATPGILLHFWIAWVILT